MPLNARLSLLTYIAKVYHLIHFNQKSTQEVHKSSRTLLILYLSIFCYTSYSCNFLFLILCIIQTINEATLAPKAASNAIIAYK